MISAPLLSKSRPVSIGCGSEYIVPVNGVNVSDHGYHAHVVGADVQVTEHPLVKSNGNESAVVHDELS